MFIEIHLIQNFAPSCLNRDDTNSPKDCIFGGVRRARISSQCIKRAIRTRMNQDIRLKDASGVRTKKILDHLTEIFVSNGKPEEEAKKVSQKAFIIMLEPKKKEKKKREEKGVQEYLIFIGKTTLEKICKLILENWEIFKSDSSIHKDVSNTLKGIFTEEKSAADIALFGRMLADMPEANIDAACQVAHALSTHRVEFEMDYFTAVDDLSTKEQTGAGMIGTVEYNSACFYRYALLDLGKLLENLKGDAGLTRTTVEAFLRSSIESIPTGKQNSFAAQNLPDFILATNRWSGLPCALSNAFERPVRPDDKGLVYESITRLDSYLERIRRVFGKGDIAAEAWTSTFNRSDFGDSLSLAGYVASCEELIRVILESLPQGR